MENLLKPPESDGDVVFDTASGPKTAEVHWFQEPDVGIVGAFVKRWR